MRVILILTYFIFILYSCSPINKQHGYLLEDVIISADEMSQFSLGVTSEKDIYTALGSPSVEISDISNIWIYLISVKTQNIFEDDNIIYQSIFRFEFDNEGMLISKEFANEENFTEIDFSREKTRVLTNAYGITEQLYESITRGQ